MKRLSLLCLALGLVFAVQVRAQAPEEESANAGFFDWTRGDVAFRLLLGHHEPTPTPELDDLQAGLAGMLAFTVYPDDSGIVGIDLEWMAVERDFALDRGWLPVGSPAERSDLDTNAVMAGLRLQLPRSLPVRPYVSASYGYVRHRMKTDLTLLEVIPIGTTGDESSSAWRPTFGAGMDAVLGGWGLSLDYRTLSTSGSFGEPYSVGGLDLGGPTIFLGAAWYPGRS